MRKIGPDPAAFASIEVARTLRKLPSAALDDLRGLLIRDQADRDAIAEQLLWKRTKGADQLQS
jgi:hypothetical protein